MYPANYWKKFVGLIFASKYVIRRFLGSGTFGAVFEVDEMLDGHFIQSVALKLIVVNPETIQQQVHELQLAIKLKHPNLINSFTCERGEVLDDKFLGLTMELASESLADHLAAKGNPSLAPDSIGEILVQVADGLKFLHNQGIIHRDLNPSNILRVGSYWKIADFGIARKLSGGTSIHTSASNPSGTLAYAAPETYEGIISPAGDVWSLGVIICELLMGRNPFAANSIPELMKLIFFNSYLFLDDLDTFFKDITQKCLIKDKKNRPNIEDLLTLLIKENNNLIKPNSSDKIAKNHFNKREESLKNKQYTDAIFKYKKAIKINPKDSKNYYNVANNFFKLGNLDDAIFYYDKAIKINPNYAKAYHNLGIVYQKLERYDEAIFQYQKAIQINTNYAKAHFHLGIVYQKLEKYDEAIFQYQKAIQINPNYAEPYYNIGILCQKLERYDEAIANFQTAVKISPKYEKNLDVLNNKASEINNNTKYRERTYKKSKSDHLIEGSVHLDVLNGK